MADSVKADSTVEGELAQDRRDDRAFGLQVRVLRKARGMSLQALALRSGVSLAMISQVERGITAPSMRSLRLIAQGLDVSVQSLFRRAEAADAGAEDGVVVRHRQRRVLDLGVDGTFVELVTPPDFPDLQTFHSSIAPGGGSSDYDSHDGAESGVVMSGSFELWLDGQAHLLSPGDSFAFQCRTPHKYRNPGKTMTTVVWSITPPIY